MASSVAFALLILFLVRDKILAVTFLIPANSKITRAELPATKPFPAEAGRKSTLAAPYFPMDSQGRELFPVIGTLIKFFLAILTALSMARVVSAPLPTPTPTRPP